MKSTHNSGSIVVSRLFVYPIKSCQGIEVQNFEVEETGPRGDREWMLVQPDGLFLSQRKISKLATIALQRTPDGGLEVRAPGMQTFIMDSIGAPSKTVEGTVWSDRVQVSNHSSACDEWFSDYLQRPCHLVRIAPNHARNRIKPYFPEGFKVGFADSAPFLLTNEASLDDVNGRIKTPVPMERFRPNIVIKGPGAFAEDEWESMTIGTVDFPVLNACDRCIIPSIDQKLGTKGPEPLRILGSYRNFDGVIQFGQRMIHSSRGRIAVGDIVKERWRLE